MIRCDFCQEPAPNTLRVKRFEVHFCDEHQQMARIGAHMAGQATGRYLRNKFRRHRIVGPILRTLEQITQR